MFGMNSRYFGLPTGRLETADSTAIVYVRRRLVPPPEQFALLTEHAVSQGDRLDVLSARLLGDPEQFWRLCDANGALRPEELTEVIGRRLRVTLPAGIPGTPPSV